MNQKMRYLNRLWEDVADRFGIVSPEMDDMNTIIRYWEERAMPDMPLTDKQCLAIIAELKNEMEIDKRESKGNG